MLLQYKYLQDRKATGGEACGLCALSGRKGRLYSMDKQRKPSNPNGLLDFTILVEMGGVEPPSESA